jgi:pimeloyl-ACP methyl ester carboxylesterase
MLIADTVYSFHTQTMRLAAGTTLAFSDTGRGFPLLLIHGLGSYMKAWSKNIPFLSRHFRCLALDLPGYGKSSKSGFSPGMEYYAAVIREFMDRMQIPACYLAGHSMGGQVAIHSALGNPDRISKLALAAPAGLETFTAPEAQQLAAWFEQEKVRKAGPAIVTENLKANFYRFPDDARSMLADRLQYMNCADYPDFCRAVSQGVWSMLKEPVYDKLPQLKMPVLIIFGRQDAYIPNRLLHPSLDQEKIAKGASALIPKASFHMLEQCGHFVQFEQAEAFNKQLLNFLSR